MEQTPHRTPEEGNQQPPTAETEGNPLVSGAGETSITPLGNAPIMASVVDEPPDRVGSPFAVNPPTKAGQQRPPVAILNVGPFHYAARGGVVAAIMLLGFATGGFVWFPAGGCVMAALGCAVATLGLHSDYKRTAAGVLMLHFCIFITCSGSLIQ